MRTKTIAMLALLMTALGGCLEPADEPTGSDEPTVASDDPGRDQDEGDPGAAPPRPTTSQVVGTCTANRNCTGAKTCGAWSAWSTCGASYQRCDASCGFITRAGCSYQATVSPQNRSRTCTMRATGATCVEVDYREVVVSCPV